MSVAVVVLIWLSFWVIVMDPSNAGGVKLADKMTSEGISGAAHDIWFRGRVQEALDGIESGSNLPVSEAEWKVWSKAKKDWLKLCATRGASQQNG